MTGRERLLKVLHGEIPDCVPVTPDISNMIPCKLTGLPFWDIYLYKKIPIWRAYIKAAKHYDIDAFADGNVRIDFDDVKLETDDAAKGGRFILSTGDQCGKDTPPENLRTMVEVARTYGKYK